MKQVPLDEMIVTGMSGAGRSSAADVLEDLGFFVIDNLPPALIPKVAELAREGGRPDRFALVVDVRSGSFMDELDTALKEALDRGGRLVGLHRLTAGGAGRRTARRGLRRPGRGHLRRPAARRLGRPRRDRQVAGLVTGNARRQKAKGKRQNKG